MKKSEKEKQRIECSLLVKHSRLLRSTVNLAYDRFQQLQKIENSVELSGTLMDGDNLRSVQLKAAEERGGIKTRMLLDVPKEIEKYDHAPLQISYCLLYAMLEKYKYLIQNYLLFQDEKIDKYCQENQEYIRSLKNVRDSILHERFDNLNEQEKFLAQFKDSSLALLLEGQQLFDDLLMRIWSEVKDDEE